jgi:hypothetical protein
METTVQFKARCLVRDLGRAGGIKYADRINNAAYLLAVEYIKEHTDAEILGCTGNY